MADADSPRRRPGRPALDEHDPSVDVRLRVPSQQYDRLYDLARQQRASVPDVIRRAIQVALTKADG